MAETSEEIRAQLKAETGVDFADYRDDALVDAVTGWSGLLGLAGDLLVALGLGSIPVVAALVVVFFTPVDGEAGVGLVVGALAIAFGMTAFIFGLRARRRVPEEVDRVFTLTGSMVDRVADDIEAGRLTVTTGQAARGLAIVAAAPALARTARRRFPLVGTVVAPIAGALLTRVLSRLLPTDLGGDQLTGLEKPARRLELALQTTRSSALPRLARIVRWVTLPLLVGGCVIVVIGLLIALVSMATA